MINWKVIENEHTKEKQIDFTPKKSTERARCWDVRACTMVSQTSGIICHNWSATVLLPGESIVFGTGVSVKLPEEVKLENGKELVLADDDKTPKIQQNYITFIPSFEAAPRSGLGFKSDVVAFMGQIDNDFYQEIKIKLFNLGNKPVEIKYGERIAQLKLELLPILPESVVKVATYEELNEGNRIGFGSSGKM
jgi:dUTPase